MLKKHFFESTVGVVVLLLGGFFIYQVYKSGNLKKIDNNGIRIIAKFTNSDGIEIGSDVKISGVKIGSVSDKSLDLDSYKAVITMVVRADVNIPIDSSAAIVSSGLLGGKYIDIRIGADDIMCKDESKLSNTQSSINLEELIGKFAFNANK